MPKGIPGFPLVAADSDVKLRLSAELTCLGTNEYTRPILLLIQAWKFLTQEWECRSISLQFLEGNVREAELNK